MKITADATHSLDDPLQFSPPQAPQDEPMPMLSLVKTALLSLAALVSLSCGAFAAEWSPPASTPGDVVIGSQGAPITVYEYASLTCPHCARFHAEVLPEFKRKWIDTGKARLVFRHFPLDKAALAASIAVTCTPPADRVAAVGKLYSSVDAWKSSDDLGTAMVDAVRPANVDAFQKCMTDDATSQSVYDTAVAARREGGVSGTPTFFVNGAKLQGIASVETLGKIVDVGIGEAFAR